MNKLKYRLEFNYEFIDNVNDIIKDEIISTSFTSSLVTYFILIDEDKVAKIFNYLKLITYNQIKIYDLNSNDEEDIPVGTDKPLGSKEAIDEN